MNRILNLVLRPEAFVIIGMGAWLLTIWGYLTDPTAWIDHLLMLTVGSICLSKGSAELLERRQHPWAKRLNILAGVLVAVLIPVAIATFIV